MTFVPFSNDLLSWDNNVSDKGRAIHKGGLGRLIGRTKGGMNTKLHAVTDAEGTPLSFFMTAGQVSDYTGAAALLDDLPKAQ